MSTVSVPARRPRARWYLLTVPAALLTLGCLIAFVATALWQDRANLALPTGEIALARTQAYDVDARANPGERVDCRFTPESSGGTAFTATFRVPAQDSRHSASSSHHLSGHWTNRAGTLTAERSGAYRMNCRDAGRPVFASIDREPSGLPNVLAVITAVLATFTIVWPIGVLCLRSPRARSVVFFWLRWS